MGRSEPSDAVFLVGFFALAILAGTLALAVPAAWSGPGGLSLLDALFISTSAVCVTGLATVDIADFSRYGQLAVLALIQAGGLGIISFTSLVLLLPGRRLPFRRLGSIRSFSLGDVEHDPRRIVRNIVAFTLIFELTGAAALFGAFSRAGVADAGFAAIFHSVSAFCNAGFSPFRDSLEAFAGDPAVLGIIAVLIVAGGIGFIVIQDLERRLRGKRGALSAHTKLVLSVTAFLVIGGGLSFWLIEREGAFAGMAPLDAAANAAFQAITPRTAGFDAVPQAALSDASKVLTVVLMFIGGAPGSIAGGIKVSTFFLVVLAAIGRRNARGEINAFGSRFPAATTDRALNYFLKAGLLVSAAAVALGIAEGSRGAGFGESVFETVSAFGTVGLSLGLTPGLGPVGKLVIIATMFAGRVGLVALAFPARSSRNEAAVYPEAEVLVG
ncbi:MAG: hypothetical protein JXA15_06560 [Spirochaetales bacterium]|nr:hypothetical protein [Spirochaetales bacterium]